MIRAGYRQDTRDFSSCTICALRCGEMLWYWSRKFLVPYRRYIDDKGWLRSGSKMLSPLRLESMSVTNSLAVKNTLGHIINSIFEFFDYNLRICY